MSQNIELWGGIECTVNRVGDNYFNQLDKNGHLYREDDLEKIASLGIKKLRYPVLWELCENDFSWADKQLNKLKELSVEPIVTLVHHGSGPRYTSLHDDKFSDYFLKYAEKVAKRYPWINYFTPVNEPLTTARFSGLYGVWYPHTRDNKVFGQCLFNQYKAIIKGMEIINQSNPNAVLVQTEDLGKAFATPSLQYQADFENERRWLTFDCLTGKINPSPMMMNYLKDMGIEEKDLEFYNKNPIKNIILGVDTYVTSVRYLDEFIDKYPQEMIGGNGQHAYVDVEAVRARKEGIPTMDELLVETWERYKKPIAITEAHLNSDEEQKIAWFISFWKGALKAKEQGVDIKAVTSWSLLGAYGWDKLVNGESDLYESGAFRVEDDILYENAMANVLRKLAVGEELNSEVKGWWEIDDRLLY